MRQRPGPTGQLVPHGCPVLPWCNSPCMPKWGCVSAQHSAIKRVCVCVHGACRHVSSVCRVGTVQCVHVVMRLLVSIVVIKRFPSGGSTIVAQHSRAVSVAASGKPQPAAVIGPRMVAACSDTKAHGQTLQTFRVFLTDPFWWACNELGFQKDPTGGMVAVSRFPTAPILRESPSSFFMKCKLRLHGPAHCN